MPRRSSPHSTKSSLARTAARPNAASILRRQTRAPEAMPPRRTRRLRTSPLSDPDTESEPSLGGSSFAKDGTWWNCTTMLSRRKRRPRMPSSPAPTMMQGFQPQPPHPPWTGAGGSAASPMAEFLIRGHHTTTSTGEARRTPRTKPPQGVATTPRTGSVHANPGSAHTSRRTGQHSRSPPGPDLPATTPTAAEHTQPSADSHGGLLAASLLQDHHAPPRPGGHHAAPSQRPRTPPKAAAGSPHKRQPRSAGRAPSTQGAT